MGFCKGNEVIEFPGVPPDQRVHGVSNTLSEDANQFKSAEAAVGQKRSTTKHFLTRAVSGYFSGDKLTRGHYPHGQPPVELKFLGIL